MSLPANCHDYETSGIPVVRSSLLPLFSPPTSSPPLSSLPPSLLPSLHLSPLPPSNSVRHPVLPLNLLVCNCECPNFFHLYNRSISPPPSPLHIPFPNTFTSLPSHLRQHPPSPPLTLYPTLTHPTTLPSPIPFPLHLLSQPALLLGLLFPRNPLPVSPPLGLSLPLHLQPPQSALPLALPTPPPRVTNTQKSSLGFQLRSFFFSFLFFSPSVWVVFV